MEWYEIPQVRETLEGFTQYMLRGQPGKLVLNDAHGIQSYLTRDKEIYVDPEKYERKSPEEQWSLVRADIVHEVAHARFTKEFPPADAGRTEVFAGLWKLVEDNRIEYKMVQMEHMGKVLLPKRSKELLDTISHPVRPSDQNPMQTLIYYMLTYAYSIRCNQTGRYSNLAAAEAAKWTKLKPLIDKSFFLTAEEVMDVALEIERILFDLETEEDKASGESQGPARQALYDGKSLDRCGEGQHGEGDGESQEGDEEGAAGNGRGEGREGDGDPEWSSHLKTDDPDTIYPELKDQIKNAQRQLDRHGIDNTLKRFDGRDNERVWGGHGSGPIQDGLLLRPRDPSKMLARVNQIMPVFRDAFKVVPPLEVADLSRAGGRLSLRDYLVDPTKPFVSMIEPKKAMMDMAIRVVCDVSGSMKGVKAELVALFAMALHNAAQEFGVHYQVTTAPLNIKLADNETALITGQENIMSILKAPAPHEDMGMILEQHCIELLQRPEELKLVVALHDGQSNDHDYLERVVKHYRRKGVTILGVGLAGQQGYEIRVTPEQLEKYEKGMFDELQKQFANDFLIPVSISRFEGREISSAHNWPLAREIPQKLARIIRNFRKRG